MGGIIMVLLLLMTDYYWAVPGSSCLVVVVVVVVVVTAASWQRLIGPEPEPHLKLRCGAQTSISTVLTGGSSLMLSSFRKLGML